MKANRINALPAIKWHVANLFLTSLLFSLAAMGCGDDGSTSETSGPACRLNSDCETDEVCENQSCVPRECEGDTCPCTSNTDCDYPNRCEHTTGACVEPECLSDFECVLGAACLEGTCVVDVRADRDRDGVPDGTPDAPRDKCPNVRNPDQEDADSDGQGDHCDPDIDNDGIANAEDNCAHDSNPDQEDFDRDGQGDACEGDADGDGLTDDQDRCPLYPSTDNGDLDGDSLGDPCDPDDDNDGVLDTEDNCPQVSNTEQADADENGIGNRCDAAWPGVTIRGRIQIRSDVAADLSQLELRVIGATTDLSTDFVNLLPQTQEFIFENWIRTPGTYQVVGAWSGWTVSSVPFDVSGHEQIVRVPDLIAVHNSEDASQSVFLQGRIRLPNQDDHIGTRVFLYVGERGRGQTITDSSGNFAFAAAREESYTVSISRDGYGIPGVGTLLSPVTYGDSGFEYNGEAIDYTLELSPDAKSIAVTAAVEPAWLPPQDRYTSLLLMDGNGNVVDRKERVFHGEVARFGPLQDGIYYVQADRPGFERCTADGGRPCVSERMSIWAGNPQDEAEVTLQLLSPGRAGISLADADLSNQGTIESPEPDLRNIDWQGADLRQANLSAQALAAIDFAGADLSGARLVGADLNCASFAHAMLNQSDFSNSGLLGARWNFATADNALFASANFSDRAFAIPPAGSCQIPEPRDGAESLFHGASFRNASFSRAKMEGLDFGTGGAESNADFEYADFEHAQLNNSELSGVRFGHAKFTNTGMQDVNAIGTRFVRASFQDVDARGSRFDEADFSDAGLAAVNANATCPASTPLNEGSTNTYGYYTGESIGPNETRTFAFNGGLSRIGVAHVALRFLHQAGDLDLATVTGTGTVLERSESQTDGEGVLSDRPSFSVRVQNRSDQATTFDLVVTREDAMEMVDLPRCTNATSFAGATLSGATITGMQARFANFEDTIGIDTFIGAHDKEGLQVPTDLMAAEFGGAIFNSATVQDTLLEFTLWNEAEVNSVTFDSEGVIHALFRGTNMTNVRFTGGAPASFLSESRAVSSDFTGGNYATSHFSTCTYTGQTNQCWFKNDEDFRTDCLEDDNGNGAPDCMEDCEGRRCVSLDVTDVRSSDFSHANLARTHWQGVTMFATTFDYSDLQGAKLQGARAAHASFVDASLRDADLDGASFAYTDLRGASLMDATGPYIYGQNAKFTRANLIRAAFPNSHFSSASFQRATMTDANLSNATLISANLGGANSTGATFAGANMREANLSEGNFSNSNFSNANMNETDLSGATFTGATITGVSINTSTRCVSGSFHSRGTVAQCFGL